MNCMELCAAVCIIRIRQTIFIIHYLTGGSCSEGSIVIVCLSGLLNSDCLTQNMSEARILT